MTPERLRDAIRDVVKEEIQKQFESDSGGFEYGTYVGEGSSPGRHNISILGEIIENIPSLNELGEMQAGDVVICYHSRLMPRVIVGLLADGGSMGLIAYGENHDTEILATSVTLVTLTDVPLSAERSYRIYGSTRGRATDSGDFGGLINAEVRAGGTTVGRDRAILRDSTLTASTNFLKPNVAAYSPPSTGLYDVTLTASGGHGTSSDIGWRGAGGTAFFHWLAVEDTGRAFTST